MTLPVSFLTPIVSLTEDLDQAHHTGIGIDGDSPQDPVILFKEVGKVSALRKHIAEGVRTAYPAEMANAGHINNETGAVSGPKIDMSKTFLSQTSMAHTRWATHGVPSVLNCHPHVSGTKTDFSLVHSEFSGTFTCWAGADIV